MNQVTVSVHLQKPHYQDYDILTRDQTIECGMDMLARNTAERIVIQDEGTLVLYVDGTWAYHSKNCMLHPENIRS